MQPSASTSTSFLAPSSADSTSACVEASNHSYSTPPNRPRADTEHSPRFVRSPLTTSDRAPDALSDHVLEAREREVEREVERYLAGERYRRQRRLQPVAVAEIDTTFYYHYNSASTSPSLTRASSSASSLFTPDAEEHIDYAPCHTALIDLSFDLPSSLQRALSISPTLTQPPCDQHQTSPGLHTEIETEMRGLFPKGAGLRKRAGSDLGLMTPTLPFRE